MAFNTVNLHTYNKRYYIVSFRLQQKFQTQGYLAKKKFKRKIFKCVYLSLFIITKIVFQVRISSPLQTQLVDGSNRKPTPGDHESSLKIFLAKLFLARCPCAQFQTISMKNFIHDFASNTFWKKLYLTLKISKLAFWGFWIFWRCTSQKCPKLKIQPLGFLDLYFANL